MCGSVRVGVRGDCVGAEEARAASVPSSLRACVCERARAAAKVDPLSKPRARPGTHDPSPPPLSWPPLERAGPGMELRQPGPGRPAA